MSLSLAVCHFVAGAGGPQGHPCAGPHGRSPHSDIGGMIPPHVTQATCGVVGGPDEGPPVTRCRQSETSQEGWLAPHETRLHMPGTATAGRRSRDR